MKIYNSLTRKLEEFKPINPPRVGMYTCGPTVYDYATIGNWRTYVLGDTLLRILQFLEYDVDYIMNITDVGHLTGDNLGDADLGEDRLEQAAKRERKSAWDIAKFYTQEFIGEFEKLNLIKPRLFTKATDHIQEQIELVEKIEKVGFTYRIGDGIYFDVGKYEKAGEYGKLSTLDKTKKGVRVEPNPEKKDPRDFALWKFSPLLLAGGEKRDMEWDSPWGKGFPGWHIECSAMSMKYLGKQFDIHVGGEDLRSTHHPNEIAQSEAATGKRPFVKYWVHGAFLLVDGGRMGKSLGNAYTLQDVEKKGFDPLDLRYFYLTGHYRKQLNFTWDALAGAKKARERLANLIGEIKNQGPRTRTSTVRGRDQGNKGNESNQYREKFRLAISDDLNMPEVLAVLWEAVRSKLGAGEKYKLLLEFDKVLGLKLVEVRSGKLEMRSIPEDVRQLIKQRERLRRDKQWDQADKLRRKIEKQGYQIEDTAKGPQITRLD